MGVIKVVDCLVWTVAIISSIIAVLLLLSIVGLAAVGIIYAQVNDGRYIEAVDNSDDNFNILWLYYMAGSSCAVLPYSIVGTIAILMLITAIRRSKEHSERKKPQPQHPYSILGFFSHLFRHHKRHPVATDGDEPGIELTDFNQTEFHEGDVEGRIDRIHGIQLIHFTGAQLAPITFGAVVGVFMSLLLSSLSLVCILWGIAIAYDNARRVVKEVWPYIVVEVIVGLVMPILLVIAVIIFSVFLEYITKGSIEARVIISKLLPVIKIVEGEKYDYWVILDRFYFQLTPHDRDMRSGKAKSCGKMCSTTPATWIITIIVGLAFLLAASYFMNSNITQQTTLTSCPHVSYEVDCFNKTTYNYINCQDEEVANMNFTLIHCFRFLRFGRDSDVIGGIARAFAFYLATLAFFTLAFHVVNVLINFKPTRLWGIGYVILGILLLVGGLTVMLTEAAAIVRLNVIQIFQFYMVAIFIFLIGILLLISKWWEHVPPPSKEPPPDALVAVGISGNKGAENKVKEELRKQQQPYVT